MEDVFTYNSGSLLPGDQPRSRTSSTWSDEEWVGTSIEPITRWSHTDNGIYGAPIGTSQAGGIVYNKPVYEELGLEVPTTWDEFMANNEAIKAAAASHRSSRPTATRGRASCSCWATSPTCSRAGPGLGERVHRQRAQVRRRARAGRLPQPAGGLEAGYFNEDFASALFDDGARMVATGEGAHYPILSGVVSTITQNYPDDLDDVGFFALPRRTPKTPGRRSGCRTRVYIPQTHRG